MAASIRPRVDLSIAPSAPHSAAIPKSNVHGGPSHRYPSADAAHRAARRAFGKVAAAATAAAAARTDSGCHRDSLGAAAAAAVPVVCSDKPEGKILWRLRPSICSLMPSNPLCQSRSGPAVPNPPLSAVGSVLPLSRCFAPDPPPIGRLSSSPSSRAVHPLPPSALSVLVPASPFSLPT